MVANAVVITNGNVLRLNTPVLDRKTIHESLDHTVDEYAVLENLERAEYVFPVIPFPVT